MDNRYKRMMEGIDHPGAWLEDRIAEADLLENYLRMSADELMREADRVQGDYLNPGNIGRISDVGRSRKGVQVMAQAGNAVEDFLRELGCHPDFQDLVAEIQPLKREDLVLPRARFSRLVTKFQLVKQANRLMEKRAEIRVLRRRMRLHSKTLIRESETRELEEKMDRLVNKAMDFTRPYREGKERGGRYEG